MYVHLVLLDALFVQLNRTIVRNVSKGISCSNYLQALLHVKQYALLDSILFKVQECVHYVNSITAKNATLILNANPVSMDISSSHQIPVASRVQETASHAKEPQQTA